MGARWDGSIGVSNRDTLRTGVAITIRVMEEEEDTMTASITIKTKLVVRVNEVPSKGFGPEEEQFTRSLDQAQSTLRWIGSGEEAFQSEGGRCAPTRTSTSSSLMATLTWTREEDSLEEHVHEVGVPVVTEVGEDAQAVQEI